MEDIGRKAALVHKMYLPVGTEPQQTSNVVVLARTNCTLLGASGFSEKLDKTIECS